MVYYTTGKFFIGFDLENEREAFRTESEGQDTTFALGKPVVLRGKKVLIDELEISTYEDAEQIQTHLSPDGLKVLIVNYRSKIMQIVFLHDIKKLKDRIKTIPLEEAQFQPSICWFSDSEQFMIAYYGKKFQVINALAPETPVMNKDIHVCPFDQKAPKVVFNDKILIFSGKDTRIVFYDVQRQKIVA